MAAVLKKKKERIKRRKSVDGESSRNAVGKKETGVHRKRGTKKKKEKGHVPHPLSCMNNERRKKRALRIAMKNKRRGG